MTIITQLLLGLPLLAIAFPLGYFLAMYTNEIEEVPYEIIRETIQTEEPEKKQIEPKEIIEEPTPPAYQPLKKWTYYFPNYQTGKAVPIQDVSLDEARKQAITMGLGTNEVLSTWKK